MFCRYYFQLHSKEVQHKILDTFSGIFTDLLESYKYKQFISSNPSFNYTIKYLNPASRIVLNYIIDCILIGEMVNLKTESFRVCPCIIVALPRR